MMQYCVNFWKHKQMTRHMAGFKSDAAFWLVDWFSVSMDVTAME